MPSNNEGYLAPTGKALPDHDWDNFDLLLLPESTDYRILDSHRERTARSSWCKIGSSLGDRRKAAGQTEEEEEGTAESVHYHRSIITAMP